MSSGSKKPTQQVADYLLSIHYGVCHLADAITRIRYNDKDIWTGSIGGNSVAAIDLPNLFGGNKKEGGVRGRLHVLHGASDQLLGSELAGRLGGTPTTVPGFRGITSLFFTGGGPESEAGFMWGSNTPYIRSVDATVRRAPKGFYPEKAMLPIVPNPPVATDGFTMSSTIDPSGAFPRFDPSATSRPTWAGDYSQTIGFGVFDYRKGSADTERVHNATASASWYQWRQLSIMQTLTFDPRLTFHGYFNASDGLYWQGWNVFNPATAAQDPTLVGGNRPKFTVKVITTGGEVIGELSLEAFVRTPTSPASPCKTVLGQLKTSTGVNQQAPWPNQYNGSSGDIYISHTGTHLQLTVESSTDSPTAPYTLYASIPVDPASISRLEVHVSDRVLYSASASTGNYSTAYYEITGYTASGELRDANPAHIVYECLTNTDWGLGLPSSAIDTASFTAAADTLYAEGFGLSMMWSSQSTIEAFLNDVLTHIDATYGIDPATGRIFLKLIRGDYSVGSLYSLDENNCRITRFQRKALGETANEVVVTWTNPETEQEETVTVHDLANYAQQGALISNSSNYYGVRSAELALRLGMRDLGRSAYPIASVELEANRKAWNFKPGDVVKLTSTEYGLVDLPIRITEVKYGRPGDSKVAVSGVEDVFIMPATAYVDVIGSQTPNDPIKSPEPIRYADVGSSPYYLLARSLGSSAVAALAVGDTYGVFLASDPNGDTLDFDLYSPEVDPLGQSTYVNQGTFDLTSRAVTSVALTRQAVTNGLTFSGLTGNGPSTGGFALIGGLENGELAVVTSVSPLNLQRGVLDTVPGEWPTGTPIWFFTWDSNIGDDQSVMVGASGSYKLIPRTGLGSLDIDLAPVKTALYTDRVVKPYRPAGVQINGAYWPSLIEGTSSLVVSYLRRNRVTEDPVVLSWTAADVVPETGTTYTVRLSRADNGALLTQSTGVTGTSTTLTSTYTGNVTLEAFAVRDGLSSHQPFSHTFELVPGGVRVTESGETRLTESGETRALEA